ncbi:hypothetical protein [Halosegnis marinus]|uniref:Uncharacterized protein n=1 Tax=Halosegnis marinus TaxID=3034023 RepID=A0ABD5ZLI8_9EURY|nr:hypothetical protein [Halosegnis sp. DT85]
MSRWSRRRLLTAAGIGTAGALAGCVSLLETRGRSLSMEPVDSAAIARRATMELDRREKRIFLDALENGTTTVTYDNPPFPPLRTLRPVEHEGRYYGIAYTITETRDALGVTVRIDYDPRRTDGPTVAYDDLPARDRALLDSLVLPRPKRRIDGWDMGTVDVYRIDEVEGSVLTPESRYDYVTHDGETYRIRVETYPATIADYRYTVHEVAGDRTAFVRRTRDRYQFRLDGLSPAERPIVEAAIRGGYVRGRDPDERAAYRSLSERFREHDAVVGSSTDPGIAYGEYLVRYGERVYWAEMEFYDTATPTA